MCEKLENDDKLENVGHGNRILFVCLALIEMHICITYESSMITQKAWEAVIRKTKNSCHFKIIGQIYEMSQMCHDQNTKSEIIGAGHQVIGNV